MNDHDHDHELDFALADFGTTRVQPAAPPVLHQRIRTMPLPSKQSRGFLPRPTWRFQSMFSATKFVVAGAIVALFGGLLLSGVLTQPSDDGPPAVGASAAATTRAEPTTETETDLSTPAPDLLSGVDLVAEEVAPGIFRVDGDGVRDLTTNVHEVTVSADGGVWLRRGGDKDQQIVRLGTPGVALTDRIHQLGTTADGQPFVRRSNKYWVPDGNAWARHEPAFCDVGTFWGGPIGPPLHGGVASSGECLVEAEEGIDRLPDGSRDGMWEHLANEELGLTDSQEAWGIAFAEDGTVWSSVWTSIDGPLRVFDGLLWHDGTNWTHVPYQPTVGALAATGLRSGGVAVGPDGAIWVGSQGPDGLFRVTSWDGETWSSFGPVLGGGRLPMTHFLDDGTIWFMDGHLVLKGAVLRGTGLQEKRPPTESPLVFGPDGNAWMVVDRSGGLPKGLYVITPEAVAAAQ